MQAEREAQDNVVRPLPDDTLWVRFVFVDHAGIPKCKAVYRDGFDGRARAGGGARERGSGTRPERGATPGVWLEPRRGVPAGP